MSGRIELIRRQALKEIADENFRTAVDAEKQRIRTRVPWWHRVCPYRIVIVRRKTSCR